MRSNLLEQEAARAAAKRLYQKVNYQGGALQSYQLSSLLQETYDFLKIPYKPTNQDIKSYADILDANKDGQVTLNDLETLAVQFLCGPGVLNKQNYEQNTRKVNFEAQEATSYSGSTYSYNNGHSQPSSYTQIKNYQEKNYQTSERGYQGSASYEQGETGQQYNQQTLYYLEITRRIFQKHANTLFTITTESVPSLLEETYQALGRKGYRPNSEDVKVWMKLCDGNGDGHVQYEEYEYFVVRSLERSGFQVYV